MNRVRTLLVGGAVLAIAAGSQASVTVATFADPSPGGTTPLFTVTDTSVAAAWTGLGLTLEIPVDGATYTDATFTMAPVARAGGVLGPGVITFLDSGASVRLIVTFDSGVIFEPFGTGASYLTANDVTFTSPDFSTTGWTEEHFAFSFANPTGFGTATRTYTASFTSSAVPEPATLAALGFGLAAIAARRRVKKS